MAGYYRKFVADYAAVVAPLTKLTAKATRFVWDEEQQQAFAEVKRRMTQAPVLALPDATKPFVIHTDASRLAIGAVLQQDQGKGLQPVAFMSHTLTQASDRGRHTSRRCWRWWRRVGTGDTCCPGGP